MMTIIYKFFMLKMFNTFDLNLDLHKNNHIFRMFLKNKLYIF